MGIVVQVVVLVGIVVQVVVLVLEGIVHTCYLITAVLPLATIMDDSCGVDTDMSTITLIEISKVRFLFQMLYIFLWREGYFGLYFSASCIRV